MINDIIKILNLKGYDIDIVKSYLEDSLSNEIKPSYLLEQERFKMSILWL